MILENERGEAASEAYAAYQLSDDCLGSDARHTPAQDPGFVRAEPGSLLGQMNQPERVGQEEIVFVAVPV